MKNKAFISILLLCLYSFLVKSQLSGNAFLSGQSNHSGIKIKFTATSGTAVTDSVYTNASGNYTSNIINGVYSILISKTGYISENYNNGASVLLTNTVVLNNTTLLPGNQVLVSGNVSGNWTNNNVYIVTGDVIVPSGSMLTIQPGTTVKFNDHYALIANGTLSAVGTAANKILFTSNKNVPAIGDWNHISPNNSSCVIDHCIIEYAANGIYFSGYAPVISNSIFRKIQTVGIYCNNCQPKISYNKVYDITGSGGAIGIWVENNSCCGIIECNEIYSCDASAYHACGVISGANIVRNNSIHDITGNGSAIGIQVRGNSKIENNYIYNCSEAIGTDNSFAVATPTISNNTLRGNGAGIGFNMPVVIVNNVITNNVGYGISGSGSSGATISHNIVWNNSTANFQNTQVAGVGQMVSTNAQGNAIDSYFNMSQDPLFVSGNAPALSPASPCLNAGDGAYSSNIGFNTAHACAAAVPTGFSDLEMMPSALGIYPNPTSGVFRILAESGDLKQVSLFNISGQEIKLEKISETDFNVGGLDNGIYFLIVETTDGLSSKKLVIAH